MKVVLERVTVTLPQSLLKDIDRREKNRSRFVVEAIRRELERRSREELRRSLQNPHPETIDFGDDGIAEWSRGLPDEHIEGLVDMNAGKPVRWIPGQGWIEGDE